MTHPRPNRIILAGLLALLVPATACFAGAVDIGSAFMAVRRDGIGIGVRLVADGLVLALACLVFRKGRAILRWPFVLQWAALLVVGLLIQVFFMAAEDSALMSGSRQTKLMYLGFLLLCASGYVICRLGDRFTGLQALAAGVLVGILTNPVLLALLPISTTITVGRDAPTIAAAMKMARAHSTVYVPKGLYKESGIELKNEVRLKGDGMGKTIISCRLTENSYAIGGFLVRGKIEDITIDGGNARAAAEQAAGILIDGGSVAVSGCEVRNTAGRGMGIYSEETLVENCVVTGNMGLGIRVHPYKGSARVIGCTIRGNIGAGIDAEGSVPITIERNTVIGNSVGIIVSGTKGTFTIANNVVRANAEEGIAVTHTETAVISANTCENNGKRGVCVWDGVEKVTVSSNHFAGNRESAVDIDGAEAVISDNVSDGDSCGIGLSGSPQAIVERNRITGCVQGSGIAFEHAVVATIRDNECSDCALGGIVIMNAKGTSRAAAEVQRVRRITDAVKRAALTTNPRNDKGIRKTSGGLIAITGNKCLDTGLYGICVGGGGGYINVEGNLLKGNRAGGVAVRDGEDVLVTGNDCQDSSGCGVFVTGGRSVVSLESNTCLRNTAGGIWFEAGAGGQAVGNTCAQNDWCGIGVRDAGTTPLLKANKCDDNGAWGLVTWAGAKVPGLPGDNTTQGNYRASVMEKE